MSAEPDPPERENPASSPSGSARPQAMPHARVLRIVLGMLLAMFLAAIDQTIVSVALVSIGRELQDFSLTPWVVAGYLVAATVATPIYGKLSDARGRRPLLLFAIGLHVFASVLCALAQSMPQLVVFRILQGLGGGGLLSLVQAVVADVAPGPQRGRYQGYLAGTFAVAAVAGPVLGGLLTHHISWRAVFWVNVPLGVAAFLLAHRTLRSVAFEPRPHRIDYAGAALLAGVLSALMVALTLLGQGQALFSTATLGLIGLSVLLLVVLVLQERQAPEPLLPPELFRNRVVVTCCAVLALQFFVMIGSTVLLPMAMQSLGRADANVVAMRMLPLTLSIPLGAFTAGRLMYKTGRYRASAMAGTATAAIATAGLAWLGTEAVYQTAALMAVFGVGLGLVMPPLLVAAQMAVPQSMIGVVTSTTALFRTLGGAIGIAVLTSILFAGLGASADSTTVASADRPTAASADRSTATAADRPAATSTASAEAPAASKPILDVLTGVPRELLEQTFRVVFGTVSLIAVIALLLTTTLPAGRLKEDRGAASAEDS